MSRKRKDGKSERDVLVNETRVMMEIIQKDVFGGWSMSWKFIFRGRVGGYQSCRKERGCPKARDDPVIAFVSSCRW